MAFEPYPSQRQKFDLLFKENTYGFRRNALRIRPIGLTVSAACALWVLAGQAVGVLPGNSLGDIARSWRMPQPEVASLIRSVGMLSVWIAFFIKASLRTAGFTYAEMLLRACDTLLAARDKDAINSANDFTS